jgi:hypothetical protein
MKGRICSSPQTDEHGLARDTTAAARAAANSTHGPARQFHAGGTPFHGLSGRLLDEARVVRRWSPRR